MLYYFFYILSCIECIHVSWCTSVRNKTIIIIAGLDKSCMGRTQVVCLRQKRDHPSKIRNFCIKIRITVYIIVRTKPTRVYDSLSLVSELIVYFAKCEPRNVEYCKVFLWKYNIWVLSTRKLPDAKFFIHSILRNWPNYMLIR